MKNYKKAYILASIVAENEGNARIDVPFTLHNQSICIDGIAYYNYLENWMIGKKAVIFIHYDNDESKLVKQFSGYLNEDWETINKTTQITNAVKVRKCEYCLDYNEADKDSLVNPYPAEDRKIKEFLSKPRNISKAEVSDGLIDSIV
jgi:hypothetical protein